MFGAEPSAAVATVAFFGTDAIAVCASSFRLALMVLDFCVLVLVVLLPKALLQCWLRYSSRKSVALMARQVSIAESCCKSYMIHALYGSKLNALLGLLFVHELQTRAAMTSRHILIFDHKDHQSP